MYARFYRWAFDRLDNNGVIAFITNRSFIDSRTFDGFRKTIQNEFDAAYIIDTKSDVRVNPKIAGTTHNVFGIQTGVAIMYLIKKFKRENTTCKIYYTALDDFWKKEKKLQWLSENTLQKIPFEIVRPDKDNNWINIADTDFESLLPLADKAVKAGKGKKAVFQLFSLGVVTARDEWVYDNDKANLENKLQFFINAFEVEKKRWYDSEKDDKINDFVNRSIKFTSELEEHIKKKSTLSFNKERIRKSIYRPFVKKYTYFENFITHRVYQQDRIFPIKFEKENILICVNHSSSKDFNVLASNILPDYHVNGDANCLPLYQYDKSGNRIENITDWGFNQFIKQYGKKGTTKESIFHYVYAVLHNPAYRKKYELNLKREFPRIPFYENFKQWSEWGKALMDLHINYETVQLFELKELSTDHKENPKPKLKADKENGTIILDENTILTGIPKEAWTYKLGNRSALEWVLDQYKEKKPKDPTIAEKFHAYKFADYKLQVIDLLKRICTVSVETMKIIEEMA